MARLIPSDFDLESSSVDLHGPEVRTLLRLKHELNDQYAIYHGVRWARADQSGSVYGEIDFIVANAAGRLLAIEQKDTQIVATDTDLIAKYPASFAGQSRLRDGPVCGV